MVIILVGVAYLAVDALEELVIQFLDSIMLLDLFLVNISAAYMYKTCTMPCGQYI